MAGDISNRSLVVLLVLAIAVSLVGTMVSVGRLSKMSGPVLTGRATQQGTVSLQITQKLLIDVTDNTIAFAAGQVAGDNTSATLDSAGTATGWSAAQGADSMLVENKGNQVAFIDVQSNVSANSGETFVCQGQTLGVDCGATVSPGFQFYSAENESGSCQGQLVNTSAPLNFTAVATDYDLCEGLDYQEGNNSLLVYLRAVIPADAVGNKAALLTFTAAAS